MRVTEILDRPIAFHRVFVTLTGSVKAAIMLSQAVYWQPRAKQADGWWFKTAEDWEEETGLTRHEQDRARKDCAKYLKSDLRGVPATLYWKVDEDALMADLFAEKPQASLPKNGKQDSRNQSNINKNTETPSETTTSGVKPFTEKDFQDANKTVDYILDQARLARLSWSGREKIMECLWPLADTFVSLTGLKPAKKELMWWMGEWSDWYGWHAIPQDVKDAWEHSKRNPGGFLVSSPASLSKTVRAITAKRLSKVTPVQDQTEKPQVPEGWKRFYEEPQHDATTT